MQTVPPSIGNNIELAPLTPDVNQYAYQNGFISPAYVEPSLGLPTGLSTTNPLSTYYFPVIAIADNYGDSRKFTGSDTLYFKDHTFVSPSLSAATLTATNDAVFGGNVLIAKNLTAYGTISALGKVNYADVVFSTTSALSVINFGLGPAIYAFQTEGLSNVATFVAGDGTEVLHVGNSNIFQKSAVGINTGDPNVALTVNGQISSNDIIFDATGNSNIWNGTYTTVHTNSAAWSNAYGIAEASFAKLSSQAFTLLSVTSSIQPTVGGNIASGKNSAILGGKNNTTNNKDNTFILGSNIVATLSSYTYVNNLSSQGNVYGKFYGDGSNLIGFSLTLPYRYGSVNGSIVPLSGANNSNGLYSFIAAGTANNINAQPNTFILGSSLTAWKPNFTYVNNISAQGLVYDLKGNSSQWGSVYTLTYLNSAKWDSFPGLLETSYTKTSAQPYSLINSKTSVLPNFGTNASNSLYTFIAGGSSNNANANNVFILGSDITATVANTTYVNNLSTKGLITAGGYNSNQWNSAFSLLCANSAQILTPSTFFSTIYSKLSDQPYLLIKAASSVIPTYGKHYINGNRSVIVGGDGNYTNFSNTFILGSNLTANQGSFTYVNNLSSQGDIYAGGYFYDAAGDSKKWTSAYTTLCSNSAGWNAFYGYVNSNFSKISSEPYLLRASVSAIQPTFGGNQATGVGSSIVGGGYNDTNYQSNTFILGSNLIASTPNYTYVNNISSQGVVFGTFYGDASKLAFTANQINGITYKYGAGPFSIMPVSGNNVTSGYFSTIAGGELNQTQEKYSSVDGGYANTASARYSHIGGGYCNCVGFGSNTIYSVIGGGYCNFTNGKASSIIGGCCNTASGTYSIIGGGILNKATGNCSAILGGSSNSTNSQNNSFILGSSLTAWKPDITYVNNLSSQNAVYGTFYGDGTNLKLSIGNLLTFPYRYSPTGYASIIPVSGNNINYNNYTFIAGGSGNKANADNVFVLGSDINGTVKNYTYVNNLSTAGNIYANKFFGDGSSLSNIQFPNLGAYVLGKGPYVYGAPQSSILPLSGGNTVSGFYSTVLGGKTNTSSATYSVVVNGKTNRACANYSSVINGTGNSICVGNGNCFTTIAGGANNTASACYSIIASGESNCVCNGGYYSSITSGRSNWVTGYLSHISGGCSNCVNSNYSAILGGSNNNTSADCTFVLGSYINATASGYTYANNICTTGNIIAGGYVQGSVPTRSTPNIIDTVLLKDNGGVILTTSDSGVTVQVSDILPYPNGFQVTVIQYGSGQITFSGINGVQIYQANGYNKTRTQWAAVTLSYAANNWVVFGDMSS